MKKAVLLFFLFIVSIHGFAQNKRIDSLKLALSTAKEDTGKVSILNNLSRAYTWSFADTAIIYAQEQLKLSQLLNDKNGEAWGMENLSNAQNTLGNYTSALDYAYKSLAIFKQLKDTFGIVVCYLDLATCYREQADYKRAIEFYQLGLKLSRLTSQIQLPFIEALMGFVYERQDKLDSALILVQKFHEQKDDWSGALTVLGTIHAKLGHKNQALDYYQKAIRYAIRDHQQKDILDAYNGMAKLYMNEKRTDSAIFYARLALTEKWARVYPLGLLNASRLLADIYASSNRNDSAVKYLNLNITLKDSLFNQQKIREAQNLAFNEQLYQQELQQKLEQADLVYKNRINIYFLLAGLVILIIVAGGLWRRNIFKQKSFAMLQQQKQQTDSQKQKLEKTLEELRSTQAQLIQSEKMASLGELTAGIAHEIQNPLNFVNNFSEVNKDLLEEMNEEIDRGNFTEAKQLARNVIENHDKINHHGKRADSIVKGMLQHSRISSGEKELTDINALADEYLRLSYQGMRAKDKSFNATLKTNLDAATGNLNVVPQEIGRVLLNLFNNAFYAVSDKKKHSTSGYEPVVSLTTEKMNGKVVITVKDNGTGIPQKIRDKIFQPFFTTKPTGQGTGLGLSMAYDIIKAQNGELKVETREGEETEFIIALPIT